MMGLFWGEKDADGLSWETDHETSGHDGHGHDEDRKALNIAETLFLLP